MLTRVFRFMVGNWETVLLAFLLSVAVWISAVVASDPNQEDLYPGSIPVAVVGLAEDLQVLGNLPETVNISFRAPQSLWNELLANSDLITAKLDMTGLTKGDQTIPVSIDFAISPVELTSVDPVEVSFVLETKVVNQFRVHVVQVGELALGYEIQSMNATPATVIVSGPESLVNQISEVQALLSVSDARNDVAGTFELVAVDQDNRQISGVLITPSEAGVKATIVQSGGYREVVVRVETIGTLPSGYRLTNISVSPPTVTVFSSDPQLVENMPGFVSTEPINLNGATDDIEARLTLDLPDNVVMVGDLQSVEVFVGVAAIETTISLSLPVQILELGPGLSASVSPETVEVFLSGPLTVLDELNPEDVIISISLAGLAVGTHLAATQAEVLVDGVVIESINPDTIEVVITLQSSGGGSAP